MAYQPNKALHPGLTIQQISDALGMTQKNLAERTGLSEKHVSQMINGEASITVDTALLLENALGGSASFWMNLDRNYQETKARIALEVQIQAEVALLANFPYNDIMKCGFVEGTRKPAERVINLWRFFGVNSLTYIKATEAVAYRKQYGEGVKEEAIASWLRCGELMANTLTLTEYNESGLRDTLASLRKMTLMEDNFFQNIQQMLSIVGVGLVCVPHFAHTQVHGATRWIGKNPILQLSIRGRDADKFWFTLFHEIGHIIRHGKKEEFLEFDYENKSEKEIEADEFAQKYLIPESEYRQYVSRGDFTSDAIKAFAASLQTDPGIVLGRLKHDSVVEYSYLSYMHSKLHWKSENKDEEQEQ